MVAFRRGACVRDGREQFLEHHASRGRLVRRVAEEVALGGGLRPESGVLRLFDRSARNEGDVADVAGLSPAVDAVKALEVVGGLVGKGLVDGVAGGVECETGSGGGRVAEEDLDVGVVLEAADGVAVAPVLGDGPVDADETVVGVALRPRLRVPRTA